MSKNGPRVSVLTPSIRPQYLHITQECLERQTFQDFEWLVEIDCRNRGYQLPKALNRLLSRSRGEIIVMVQDCITIPDDFLERVVANFNENVCVTYPVGKKQGDTVIWDWRKFSDSSIEPQCWETDIASAPRKAFFEVGGYDEAYCDGWSWENVEIAYRLDAAGYKFACDNTVLTEAIDHDAEIDNPFRNKKPNNDWRAKNTKVLCEAGDFKLDYLYEPLYVTDGDIADRYSILVLKKDRLANVDEELYAYQNLMNARPNLIEGTRRLYEVNGRIWDLEADIRQGKEGALGLEEVGKRALKIRDFNKERILIKNEINKDSFQEIKVDHASI